MPINVLSTNSDIVCDIHDHPLEQNVEMEAGKKTVEVDYFQCDEADEYDVETQSSEMEQDLEMEAANKTMEVEDCLHNEADEYVTYDVETEQSSNMNDGDAEIEHNSSISSSACSVMTCDVRMIKSFNFLCCLPHGILSKVSFLLPKRQNQHYTSKLQLCKMELN